ncbi:MAG TPA: chorismate-binding protein [Thermoanaerobaculia bacterium]|nr:chorismate-binding protein [Thermoanaerobaculia bacterium]
MPYRPGMRAARFDDFRPAGCGGFELVGAAGEVVAREAGEVREALARVERAVAGGLWAAGFVAYEAAPGLDPGLAVRLREAGDSFAGLPLVAFGLFRARREVANRDVGGGCQVGEWRPSLAPERHAAAVAEIQRRIAAGDTYQVNHTFRLRARFDGDPGGLYRDLGRAQGGAFAAHLDLGRFHVVCASPELFFELEGDRLVTRPMKGTAARGRWSEEDRAAAARLAASPKERAENVMIVDLLRNDLGRLAVPGTVEVEELFAAERYPTVWQLTSTVACRLPHPPAPLADLFAALFPCGSVTGAPKRSTMAIVAALEDSPRGVYTGAVGWLAPPGTPGPRARFAVAIRTAAIDREAGLAEYGVGGGVTAGSSAAGEHAEALLKARVLAAPPPPFSLIETMRWEPAAGFPLLAGHLDRLEDSADYFGFPFERARIEAALRAAVAERVAAALDASDSGAAEQLGRAGGELLTDAVLRVRLVLSPAGEPTVTVSPLPPSPGRPLRLALDPEPVDPADPFLFHKTTLRDRYDRRRARWPNHDDVLLVNTRGELTESTIANLAVHLDGRWWTPPLDSGCLPGVARADLLARGRLAERPLRPADLARACGVALVNALRGWRASRHADRPSQPPTTSSS